MSGFIAIFNLFLITFKNYLATRWPKIRLKIASGISYQNKNLNYIDRLTTKNDLENLYFKILVNKVRLSYLEWNIIIAIVSKLIIKTKIDYPDLQWH